jgi:hypothetical protein
MGEKITEKFFRKCRLPRHFSKGILLWQIVLWWTDEMLFFSVWVLFGVHRVSGKELTLVTL